MTSSTAEHLRTDERGQLATNDFAHTAGLAPDQVRELIDYGLLPPGELDLRTALSLRAARRQGKDFDLDLFTIGLIAGYLRRIEDLENEVRQLRAERPARTVYSEVSFTSVAVRGTLTRP